MSHFRHGQWVSTSTKFDGAHTTPDGRSVGIYQRGRTDSLGGESPQHVAIVRPDGTNLVAFADSKAVDVLVDPADLTDLQPLLDLASLPPGRALTAPK